MLASVMALRTLAGRKESGNSSKKWFALFVGIVMIASVAAFVLSLSPNTQSSSFRYGGLTFRQDTSGFFSSEINDQPISFRYMPEDLTDIGLPEGIVQAITSTSAISITYPWNSSLAQGMALFQLDASNVLTLRYDVFTQPGFTTANQLNTPVITCANATSFVPVLLLQDANSTGIGADSSNPSCIILEASTELGFSRVSERFLYALLAGRK